MVVPMDTEMLRIKLLKEIETPHRITLESKQNEIEKLAENLYEIRRQHDILKTQFENNKFEYERELNDLRERQKQEIHEMIMENQSLQSKVDDNRDRDLIR
jgi:hypothetical protein